MVSGTVVVLAIITVALVYFLTRKKRWERSPPGPKGWPYIGNMLDLEPLQHLTYCKWATKYGPIYRVDIVKLKMVVVSDHKMVKEMFSEGAFSGRIDFSIFDVIQDKEVPLHGVVNTEGKHWEELRRFTLRQLRDYGFGKSVMEEPIMVEVNEFIERLKVDEGKPVGELKDRFSLAVVNALWTIMTGKRMNQNDPALMALTSDATKKLNEIVEGSAYLLFWPALARYFPKLTGYTKFRKFMDNLCLNFIKPREEHLKTYEDGVERDFIDTFIKEIKKTTDPTSPFYGKVGSDNLLAVMIDLYFAGSDTTSITLAWMILYLSKHPEIQKKFQQEIEHVTGNSRQTSVSDRPNMPYTEALIAETLRFSTIVPLGGQHRALEDQEYRGYLIPKGTVITSNLHYIHHDPAVWGDPENFRPERFLSPDAKTFRKHEALLAFSIGRRQCIGESLARDTLFLFSTNVFQRFWVEFDKTGPDHGYEPEIAFVIPPKPYRVIFKDRLQ